MKSIICLLGLISLLSACGGSSQGPAKGPNAEARSHAFKVIAGDMKMVADVLNGPKHYEIEAFKTLANELLAHSKTPFDYFDQDPDEANGNALPAVWLEPEKFKQEEDKFLEAVANFNTAAQSGRLDDIKASFSPVGASCKSCHTSFKQR